MHNKRGHGKAECSALVNQLERYTVGAAPFDLPFTQHSDVKTWWKNVLANDATHSAALVDLAHVLYDIVPHAANTERLFSVMGWFNAPRRSQQSVSSLYMMTAIKTSLERHAPIRYA